MTAGRLTAIPALALVAFALLFVSACRSESTISIGESMSGKTVSLHEGDKLAVSLESHATTGCRWKLESVNASVLKPTRAEFVSEKQGPAAVASAGVYTLSFEAATKGVTALELSCVRSLDPKHPVDSFGMRVVVK